MKRLKNKILSMEPNTTTYKAMYEGSMTIIDPASTMPPYVDYSSTYYNENIGFDISTTHKLAQDKPTVVISIPCDTWNRYSRQIYRERRSRLLPSGFQKIH